MAYTNYDFYTSKYFGSVISSTDVFTKWEDRASDELNLITFDRLDGVLPEDEKLATKVQKAVCELSELLYRLDNLESSSGVDELGKGKQIKSISAGAESITYSSGDTLLNQASKDSKVLNEIKYQTVARYLSGTGLLYAGKC